MMGGHGGPMRRLAEMPEEKAVDRSKVLGRLLRLMLPYRKALLAAMGLVILAAAAQGLAPMLMGRAVDQFIIGKNPRGLANTMLLLAAVYFGGYFATRFQIYYLSKIGQELLADLRRKVFEKIESLSLSYLEKSLAGDVMSRLVNDIDALNNFFSQGLAQMIGTAFSIAGIAIAMLILNWQLGLAVLVMVPVLLLATRFFSRWARSAFRRSRKTLGDVSAGLEEELSGVKVAQAFNRTEENVRRFSERNAANRDANISANAVTSAFAPTLDVIAWLDIALVAGMGGALVMSGKVGVGVVIAFLQYVQNFFRPLQTVAQLWTMAQSAFAAAERVFELLDTDPGVVDAPGAEAVRHIEGKVEFQNVTFSYDPGDPVLCNISFNAQPGQTVAIVGPTGAGKSTIASLIARFYDVDDGTVLVDGRDVRSVQQRSLRAHMGIVTQEPFLFSGTLMENIRYGRLDASDAEVLEAACIANVDDFASRLPEGYATNIGERGKMISQGQRQLITIARAVLANPRILIMDEATANVDTRTEVSIQKALNRLLKGRTSFVIAHRLSTIRSADLVLVIDNGEIVESGNHASLMERNGLYADLYQRQFYQPDGN